ncbi:MAG: bacillithiol biosynthesis deacetylase BshB1 [Ignavibacteria bacterium]|nr:bacillithiol biosynthesis deacetylase BshB1 [Ignavibacteria bacterium]
MKKTGSQLDALIFAAHPDDAELCCGGTIAAITAMGKKAGIIDLTRGELGTRGTVKTRQAEAKMASDILGIEVRHNLNIPDGNIINNTANRSKVIKMLRLYTPKIVFLPHHIDRHPDHLKAHELVKESIFYSGLIKIKTPDLDPFRPARSLFYMQSSIFEPNVLLDISSFFEIKMKAVQCYSTQFYSSEGKSSGAGKSARKEPDTFISSKNFMEYIEARSRFYGFQIGVKYAEAFFSEEKLKLTPGLIFDI